MMPDEFIPFNACKIGITTLDPTGACDSGFATIFGEVLTENGNGVEDFTMTLHGSGFDPVESDKEGRFAFPSMDLGGSYAVSSYNNNDIMKGVTTLDLIMIQRHILELDLIESPYKLIAADINNSGRITSSDLLELRKMILGIYAEFPNNMSWRTVDAYYEFSDPQDPWTQPIPEGYTLNDIHGDMLLEFVGIKVGDVNGSVESNFNQASSSTRSTARTLEYEVDENSIDIYPTEVINVAGLQMTLDMGDNDILSISSDVLNANDVEFFEVSEGIYNIVWANNDITSVSVESPLLTLELSNEFKGKIDLNRSKNALIPEIYMDQDLKTDGLIVLPRDLEIETTSSDVFSISQNNPNPWMDYTTIALETSKAERVTLSVFDVTGRLVHTEEILTDIGVNLITLDNVKVPGAGVFHYVVSSGDQRVQEKMIKLK